MRGTLMRRLPILALILSTAGVAAWSAEKYTGPVPPKSDLPYLAHADNLIETERHVAREETRKDAVAYVLPGAASPARTPLAEPIFLVKADKLVPEKLSLYRMEIRGGNREVVIPQKKVKNPPRPVPLVITRLGNGIYRVEVDAQLENGQYTLSPDGSNDAFAFEIY